MKLFYSLTGLFCIFSSIVYPAPKEPKAATPPTMPDLGYMFHDGTNARPHAHINYKQVQQMIASVLPTDTVLTAETDDMSPDSSKESRIAIILYDPEAKGWFVDYAVINPQSSGRLATLDEAQLFAFDFLKLPSAKSKKQADLEKIEGKAQVRNQAEKQEAARKEQKRKQQLSQNKYRLPTSRCC